MASNDASQSAGIRVHTFSDKLLDTQTFFQVLTFDNGLFLWVGTSQTRFGDLSLAMKTKFSKEPSTSTLLGSSESPCNAIAQRLAKKTSKQVFVGGDLSYNQLMLPLIEKRIGEEIKTHPEIFME